MRADIKLDDELRSYSNSVGDLRLVAGDDYLVQRAVLLILDTNVDWQGQTITPGRVADYRSKVETRLTNDDVIDVPVAVEVKDVQGDEITLNVQLGEQTLVIEGP